MTAKEKAKSELLLEWIKANWIVSSVDIRKWGLENFYISADRVVRKMVENGAVVRLSEEEINLRNLRKQEGARIAWYKA